MHNNEILVQRSSRLSLSIWIDDLCFLVFIIELNVFLTPSGSREVEMLLFSVACLAFLCVQPLCCPSRDVKQAGWSRQDSAALPIAACHLRRVRRVREPGWI